MFFGGWLFLQSNVDLRTWQTLTFKVNFLGLPLRCTVLSCSLRVRAMICSYEVRKMNTAALSLFINIYTH